MLASNQPGRVHIGRRGTSLPRYLRRLIWLSMLPLLLLAIVLSIDVVRRLQAADDGDAALLAKRIADLADDNLASRIRALQVLADSDLIDSGQLDRFQSMARSFHQHFGSDVVLADPGGQMLMHSDVPIGAPLPRLPKPSGRSAFETTLSTGKPSVGDLFVGPVALQVEIAVAVPVVRHGQITDVLLSAVEARQLKAQIDRLEPPAGWRVGLFDGNGGLIAGEFRAPETQLPAFGVGESTAALSLAPWRVVVEVAPLRRMLPMAIAVAALITAISGASVCGFLTGQHGGRKLAEAVESLASRRPEEADALHFVEIAAARRTLDAMAAAQETTRRDLLHSESTFRAMFDGLPSALVLADADRRIRLVNPAFTRLFGYTPDEVVGQTTESLYADPNDFSSIGSRLAADARPRPQRYGMLYRRRDGSEFWAESIDLRLVDSHGHLVGLLGLHAMSERRAD